MAREVVLHGKAVAVREAGKTDVTTYPTPKAARAAYQKLLAKDRDDDAPAVDNTDLIAQIAKHPADDTLRMVYADWLQAAGNPRGELIALQARRDTKLAAKAKRLIAKHPEWLGALGDRIESLSKLEAKDIRLEWHMGFLCKIELRSNAVDADLIGEIAKLESARFVQHLVLGGTDNYRKVVTVLAKTGWPACIHTLSIGHQRWGEYLPTSNHCGEIVAAIKKYPRLVELDITPGGSKLDGIDVPTMRRMRLRDVTTKQLAAIAKAKWPGLEKLGVRVIEARDLATLLATKLTAPDLRVLELHVWRDDQQKVLIDGLPKAAILRGIERVRVVADKPYVKHVKAALPILEVEQADDEADLA